MLRLTDFLESYFKSTFDDFQRKLAESGKKEAFLKAFIAGYEFNPHITVDLNDEIVEIVNNPRIFPIRIRQFIDKWKESI